MNVIVEVLLLGVAGGVIGSEIGALLFHRPTLVSVLWDAIVEIRDHGWRNDR